MVYMNKNILKNIYKDIFRLVSVCLLEETDGLSIANIMCSNVMSTRTVASHVLYLPTDATGGDRRSAGGRRLAGVGLESSKTCTFTAHRDKS